PKKMGAFFKINTKVTWTTEGKALWEAESNQVKLQHPNWSDINHDDYYIYKTWSARRDPNIALELLRRGKYVNLTQYRQYLKALPIDKWIDPRYNSLQSLPEDSNARKL